MTISGHYENSLIRHITNPTPGKLECNLKEENTGSCFSPPNVIDWKLLKENYGFYNVCECYDAEISPTD